MMLYKDHGRRMLAKATTIFFLFSFFALLLRAQDRAPISLVHDPGSLIYEVHVGTPNHPAASIKGISLRLKGDLKELLATPPQISFEGGWFTPAAGNWSASWVWASDSSWVDFTIQDESQHPHSGYGKFLQFTCGGGYGNLILEDMLKAAGPGTSFLNPNFSLRAYPNPVAAGQTVQIDGLVPGTRVLVLDAGGKTLAQLVATGPSLALPALAPGVYLLRGSAPDARGFQVKKLVVH
jgi:hypothetical protein